MDQDDERFYDDLAQSYHLIFEDWDVAIRRQQAVLSRLLPPPATCRIVLDCACGIGTQALGLAQAGYSVEGSDLSGGEIKRAKTEAATRGLEIAYRVDDMRTLRTAEPGRYGAVLACDNALPHLDSDEELHTALGAMHDRLRAGGRLIVSLRDYGPLMQQRPSVLPPAMYEDGGQRRIVHQVWDWHDGRRYTVHLYITREVAGQGWSVRHFTGRYRAVTPAEIAGQAERAGFRQIEILSPAETGYYQPIVSAERI